MAVQSWTILFIVLTKLIYSAEFTDAADCIGFIGRTGSPDAKVSLDSVVYGFGLNLPFLHNKQPVENCFRERRIVRSAFCDSFFRIAEIFADIKLSFYSQLFEDL